MVEVAMGPVEKDNMVEVAIEAVVVEEVSEAVHVVATTTNTIAAILRIPNMVPMVEMMVEITPDTPRAKVKTIIYLKNSPELF